MDKMSERESIEFAVETAGRVWKTRESQTRERLAEALGSLLGMVERGDLRIKEGGSETVKAVKAPTPKRYISMEDIRKLSVQDFVNDGEESGFPTVALSGYNYSFGVKYFEHKAPVLFATYETLVGKKKVISTALDSKGMTMGYVLEKFGFFASRDDRVNAPV